MVAARMIVLALTQQAPPVLLLALLILCYLTVLELRRETDLPFLLKAWWTLFVFLGHVAGFAVFWLWLFRRRRAPGPA
jgi:hypothetical protein